MFSELIIFLTDLMLALAIVVTLYVLYLITATGIFVSVIFYLLKGEMEKKHDFNKGRMWVPDSGNATEKPLPSNIEKVGPRMLPAYFPAEREKGPSWPKRSSLSSKEQRALWQKSPAKIWPEHSPQPTKRYFLR
uniref:Uncharacterized protein n=1 Tax=Spermophilus dauricus TaxID=99837 RepID=A0A8C9P4M4_SPEDA